MFPVLWPIVVMYAVAYALAGMAIGAITGWVVSRMTTGRRPGLVKDALLQKFRLSSEAAGVPAAHP